MIFGAFFMVKVGFIDPYISPEEISTGLETYALKSVGIFQRKNLDDADVKSRFKPNLFDETIYIEPNDSTENIIAKLKLSQVDFVFNGFDRSTELSDILATALHPEIANDTKTSCYRYDKFFGQEQLRQAGLKTTKYLGIFGNTLTPEQEHSLSQWDFPLILKPADAGGTIGYYECNDIDRLKQCLEEQITSHFGHTTNSFIVQEKLIGHEYAIDTFSLHGQHQLIHIRKYQKEYFNGVPISRQADTLLPTDPLWQTLVDYMHQALNAVELKNGFCHMEVFVTNKGLFAIDINPRLPGASNSSCILAKETYGYSHVEVLSHSLLNKSMAKKTYKFGRVIYLQNLLPRVIGAVKVDKIKHLPSFKCCITNIEENTALSLPQKLADTVAFVVLAHADLRQLDADCAHIFALEQNSELF